MILVEKLWPLFLVLQILMNLIWDRVLIKILAPRFCGRVQSSNKIMRENESTLSHMGK